MIQEREFQMFLDRFEKDGELGRGQLKPSNIYTNEFNPYAKPKE